MKKIMTCFGVTTLLILVSCHSRETEEKIKQTKFNVTSAMSMDTAVLKEYVCQIRSIRHIEIRTQERGYLQNIYVDEGQHVKKGQLLFRIMPKLYAAETRIAQAEAELAEIEYKNTRGLASENVVSKNELAMAKARLDKARAKLDLAKVHLSFTEIRAPYDGLIDRFHARLGSLLDEGDLLVNLSDNSQMWVYFNVSESEYLDYKSGANKSKPLEVELKLANGSMFNKTGLVKTIEADFNNETGTIPFRATFPNPNGLLRHGETGNIQVKVPVRNALLIPQKATFEILDKKYVFIVDKSNILHARRVNIEYEMPHLYAISSGLSEEDKILLDGLRKVKDGDKVHYRYQNPEKAFSNLNLSVE